MPRGLQGLSDYEAALYRRTIETRGGAGQGTGPYGPDASPIIPIEGEKTEKQILTDIRNLLFHMPEAMVLAFRTHFLMQPREGIPWAVPSATVALAGVIGATVDVATFTMDERFTGAISGVGVNVIPPGSFPDVTWDLLMGTGPNRTVIPGFSARTFGQNTYQQPNPFLFEITQSRTITLRATNLVAAPVSVQGIITGWREFMGASDYKGYGASPATGIG
jgi:hypothetical protein